MKPINPAYFTDAVTDFYQIYKRKRTALLWAITQEVVVIPY